MGWIEWLNPVSSLLDAFFTKDVFHGPNTLVYLSSLLLVLLVLLGFSCEAAIFPARKIHLINEFPFFTTPTHSLGFNSSPLVGPALSSTSSLTRLTHSLTPHYVGEALKEASYTWPRFTLAVFWRG